MKKLLSLMALTFLCLQIKAQDNIPEILTMKDRSEVIDQLLVEKIETVLPQIMRREGIDMWVVISREYNEDPVIETLLPSTWLAARRRTVLIMYDQGGDKGIESLAVARYDVGKSFKSAWNKEKQPNQWARVAEIIRERNPKKIGINKSDYFGLADGIVATDLEAFREALDKKYRERIVSAEKVAIGWLETRTASEMAIYPQICRISHEIIQEAFSDKVIQPGVTTTEDVVWWMRERIRELKLQTWFHPTVDVQRSEEGLVKHLYSFSGRPNDLVILPGDLLHCDFGITYLRLNTDCQELAYVLKPEEKGAPEFLVDGLKEGNRVQDFLTTNMIKGKTGNQILAKALQEAKVAGLRPSIYTHPLGLYGHSAGTTIGMWDSQGGVMKDDGENYPLNPNTVYAIELNTTITIPEWKRDIRIMLEEAGFFGEDGFRYVNGRQTELLLIPRIKEHQGN